MDLGSTYPEPVAFCWGGGGGLPAWELPSIRDPEFRPPIL